MKKDFVSIIVPTLNASRTINSTLNSIVKQSFKKWEVIIIDGHSTDNTISIVKKFQNNKFKVYFLSKKKGLAEARYLGIKKSRGNYIAFLDADDIWKKNKLKFQLKYMKKNNALFSATKYTILNKKFHFIEKVYETKVDFDYLLYNRPICNSSVLIDKNTILSVAKKFRYNIYAEDYMWWLEILKKKIVCHIVKKNLTIIKLSSNNRSKNFFKNFKDLYFIYKNINKFSYFKVFKIYLFLIKNTFLKNLFKIKSMYLDN